MQRSPDALCHPMPIVESGLTPRFLFAFLIDWYLTLFKHYLSHLTAVYIYKCDQKYSSFSGDPIETTLRTPGSVVSRGLLSLIFLFNIPMFLTNLRRFMQCIEYRQFLCYFHTLVLLNCLENTLKLYFTF